MFLSLHEPNMTNPTSEIMIMTEEIKQEDYSSEIIDCDHNNIKEEDISDNDIYDSEVYDKIDIKMEKI